MFPQTSPLDFPLSHYFWPNWQRLWCSDWILKWSQFWWKPNNHRHFAHKKLERNAVGFKFDGLFCRKPPTQKTFMRPDRSSTYRSSCFSPFLHNLHTHTSKPHHNLHTKYHHNLQTHPKNSEYLYKILMLLDGTTKGNNLMPQLTYVGAFPCTERSFLKLVLLMSLLDFWWMGKIFNGNLKSLKRQFLEIKL